MTKILLVQGANLSFLGRREPAIYGTTTAAELDVLLQSHAKKHDYALDIFYSNIEGEAINRIANSNFLSRWGAFRRFRQAAIAAEKAHDKLRAAVEAA